MLSVYKKELKTYFLTYTGYATIALFLFAAGIFVSIFSFFHLSSSIETAYSDILFVLLAIVPMLSFRSLTEEKRNKTDVLLNSLPIKTSSYVLGKYFAELTLIAIPIAVTFLYTVILSFYGKVNFVSALSATFALFLCAAAMLAIGLFISSLFESIALSAAVTFGALFLSYLVPSIVLMIPSGYLASFAVISVFVILLSLAFAYITSSKTAGYLTLLVFEGALVAMLCISPDLLDGAAVRIVDYFSLTERFSPFSEYGIFDLESIVYYVSVSVFFVFLASKSTEWRIRK